MRFIFVDLDQWPPRADVVESIVVVSTYHGTRSVVVTYKPSMLVPRARFPACALLQVDRFGAAVASGGALTVVSSSTWRDLAHQWPCGVTASTLDPESSNRGSNPRKALSDFPQRCASKPARSASKKPPPIDRRLCCLADGNRQAREGGTLILTDWRRKFCYFLKRRTK